MPLPAHWAAAERQHLLWTTPHGVLKAALRNTATATVRTEGNKTAVAFTEPGRFTVRIVPHHQDLPSYTQLGKVAWALVF